MLIKLLIYDKIANFLMCIQGTDPVIPPYLRYEGKVRNLRLSRREVSVIINDIWLGKMELNQDISMQDYVTKYFEDR